MVMSILRPLRSRMSCAAARPPSALLVMIATLGLLQAPSALGQPPGGPYGYGAPYYGRPYYAPPYYGQQPTAERPTEQAQPAEAPAQRQAPAFRPLPQSNAEGVPPGYSVPPMPRQLQGPGSGQSPYRYPARPNWTPGYDQQPFGAASGPPPRVELRAEELDPYLQQPVVLHLDIVSSDNLSTADVEPAPSSDFLVKTLKGSETTTRTSGGRREIINSFALTAIPLRAGDVELPKIKVTGDLLANGRPQRYDAETERPIRLQVRPSMTSVRPWLPLKSLALESKLDREGALAPGQAVTLALEITGVGATAVQLPSLENQLTGPDFRVYREQTLTDTELSADKRNLTAKRTEYYTLVPLTGGDINLPEMSIAWWNVDADRREVARLPIKTLKVRGSGLLGLSTPSLTLSGWSQLWIPITGILLIVAGYWVGVLFRGSPLKLSRASLALIARAFTASYRLLARYAGPYLSALHPRVLTAAARRWIHRHTPTRSHLQRCIRHANRASTPEQWCVLFEEESRACLRHKGELTQPALTRLILNLRPGASPETLERLMRQLDAARFGGESIDFNAWKRELGAQVRSRARFGRSAAAEPKVRWAGLPALNPGV